MRGATVVRAATAFFGLFPAERSSGTTASIKTRVNIDLIYPSSLLSFEYASLLHRTVNKKPPASSAGGFHHASSPIDFSLSSLTPMSLPSGAR